MKPTACIVVAILIVICACDSVPIDPPEEPVDLPEEEEEVCPPEPSSAELTYFPLEVGQQWTFDYRYGTSGMGGTNRTIGTLTWDFASASECENGERHYVIEESFEGTDQVRKPDGEWADTRDTSWQRQLFIERSDSLLFNRYVHVPVRYLYPPATPDTVSVIDESRDMCQSHRPCDVRFQLVRDIGLTHYRYTDMPSLSFSVELEMSRRDP